MPQSSPVEKATIVCSGLPRSGKNSWKMKLFRGQGKVREFCKWSGKFRKDFESQVKSGNLKWLYRKFIYSSQRGANMYFLMR